MVSSVQCGLFTSVCTVLFSPVYFPGSGVLFHSVSSVRDMFRTLTKYCSHSAQVVSSVSFRTESLQDAFEILGTNQGSQRNSYTQYTLYPVSTRGKHRRLSSPTSNVRKGCNDTRMVLTIVNKPAEYEKRHTVHRYRRYITAVYGISPKLQCISLPLDLKREVDDGWSPVRRGRLPRVCEGDKSPKWR